VSEQGLPALVSPLPAVGTHLEPTYVGCFGCGDAVIGGLRLRFTVADGLSVSGEFGVTEAHLGARGLAHGGILSTVMDEAMGRLGAFFDTKAVTASLKVDFLQPVPLGTTLCLRARVDRYEARKLWASAEARLRHPDGDCVTRAASLFIFVGAKHFTRAVDRLTE
jgi:acyl-coenzyme A thioesterase PaaI-like protein